MNIDRFKTVLYGQLAGMTLVNIVFFIGRTMEMGFYEAVGRSVVAYVIGLALIGVAFFLALGIFAFRARKTK